MALEHLRAAEPVNVLSGMPDAVAGKAVALFKGRDLEVVRIPLVAGAGLPMHHVPGEITIHCLYGHLQVHSDGNPAAQLRAGELIYLPGGIAHDLLALEDAVALVTIALNRGCA